MREYMHTCERDWVTAPGLRAVVVRVDRRKQWHHWSGHVALPMWHPLCGRQVSELKGSFSVPGGIAHVSMNSGYPIKSEALCWIGFDTDLNDSEFVVMHCESLAVQLSKYE